MALITIIGAGMMGSAMSIPACDNGHTVRLVGTHLDREIIDSLNAAGYHPKMQRMLPAGIAFYHIEEVQSALQGADLVICGVSSFGVTWFGNHILPLLHESTPLLSITKGLELLPDRTVRPFPETLKCMTTKKISINAVGGPCTSYELADRHQTHVVFCGLAIDTLQTIRTMLQTTYYHISISTDIVGVEVAVALKNAYALGVSFAIGLAEQIDAMHNEMDAHGEASTHTKSITQCIPHYNTQAALFTQSVREMTAILALLGGKPENIRYGIGDLYVTIFGGRTRLLGTLLGRGLSFAEAMQMLPDVTLESVVITSRIAEAIRTLAEKGKIDLMDFPLLMHIDEIINDGRSVSIPWKAFTE